MNKQNVWLVQVNNAYGGGPRGYPQCFLPYSVGLLQAYAMTFPDIRDAFHFAGFVFLREDIDAVLKRMEAFPPSVVAFSVYIWNSRYTLALARAVKNRFPHCVVVLGGPHVPTRRTGAFFAEHPYADLLVQAEGEETFADILRMRLAETPIWEAVAGAVTSNTLLPATRERRADLDTLPSPYLTGVFDDLMKLPYDFHASQETHRGCPFSCSFCDWGSSVYTKVRKFGDDRVKEELNWFAAHQIDLVYNCDANFAMYERDVEVVHHMAGLKSQTGYPKKFRAAWAKNSGERVFAAAKALNDAGMCKGVTLSFQSMDDRTLKAIKRNNIKMNNFADLIRRYKENNIPTYTELIIGLPGETYDSFANGIAQLLDAGCHEGLQVYNCEVLPNSEMADPEYIALHGIQTARVPVLFFHGTPSTDPHQEEYELIIRTGMLPTDDWLRCWLFAWAVEVFHCLGLTQLIARYVRKVKGIGYRDFYEALLLAAHHNPESTLGKVYWEARELYQGMPEGKSWGIVDKQFGEIIWPTEEGSYLKTVVQSTAFYKEIIRFLYKLEPVFRFSWTNDEVVDLIAFQHASLIHPRQGDNAGILYLRSNLPDVLSNEETQLAFLPAGYRFPSRKSFPDLPTYAQQVVWYGRKGGTFLHHVERC